jgi:hypothetical protein
VAGVIGGLKVRRTPKISCSRAIALNSFVACYFNWYAQAAGLRINPMKYRLAFEDCLAALGHKGLKKHRFFNVG